MKKQLWLLLGILLVESAQADIIGVTDAALLAKAVQQLEQLQSQYQMLKQTYSNAQSQLEGIQQLKNYNSGHYGFGNLSNSLEDLKQRQWSANTWDEALQNISGGNPSRYQQLVKAYQQIHITLNDNAYLKGATRERLQYYQQGKAVNQAVTVQATYAFNEINAHLKAIYALSAKIEKTPNTKSAIDLNSRLLTEIAYIQTEQLKLQTLLSQQSALSSFNELATDGEEAKFNTLPDE